MDVEFIQIEGQHGGWQLLFQKLHQISRINAGPQLIAKKPMNVIRNRYRDVLPIDSTRVKLNDPDNDYINANHVQFDEMKRKYILTQGPLEHTCPHFWQMVWENNSGGIVMLNKCVERGMNKCYPYWPQAEDPPLEVGTFRIENLGTDEEPSYQLSNLKLQNTQTGDSRVILHFHYTKWPDFGVPQNPEVFLEFLYAVRESGVISGGESDEDEAGKDMVSEVLSEERFTSDLDNEGVVGEKDSVSSEDASEEGGVASKDVKEEGVASEDVKEEGVASEDMNEEGVASENISVEDVASEDATEKGIGEVVNKKGMVCGNGTKEGVARRSVGPCVVHCSAGIGRTGTFCLVDVMLAKLEACKDLSGVNVQSVLLNMRRQRLGLIQTPDQLRFSYIAILQGAIQDLHLETSSYEPELSESEEDSLDDSDSEEEDEDERMERKFPSLSRQYGTQDSRVHDVDIPPPLPPRPPDTLPPSRITSHTPSLSEEDSDDAYEKPPPPPPSTRPPGPPTSPPMEEAQLAKRRKLDNEFELSPNPAHRPSVENGEVPPPVPPRNQSLSPSPSRDNGQFDSSPFLGEGRGGSPPRDEIPPPIPAKNKPPSKILSGDIEEEEKALISELDELERLVSKDPPPLLPNGDLSWSGADVRRAEREARRERTRYKIQEMREQMENGLESEWSVPWLLVGFVAVLGYCA